MFYLFSNVSDVSSNQVSLRIQEDWNDDYARESSPAYTDLKNRTETQVSKGNIVRSFPVDTGRKLNVHIIKVF